MFYLMGRSLWFGAVSSQRAFAGVVVSVRDEGTPSLPPFAPNSILALEDVLFVASPLMLDFAGTGVMEESVAATVAALPRCDDGCGIAQRGLCPPCFQYVGCGLFPLGSDQPLVAATDFAFLVSFVGLSRVTDFLGSVVFAGLLELGTGLFISCRVKGTKENAKVQESCLKAVFDFFPQVIREGAAACIAITGFLPSAAACRMPAAAFLGLASMVEMKFRAAAAFEGTLTFFGCSQSCLSVPFSSWFFEKELQLALRSQCPSLRQLHVGCLQPRSWVWPPLSKGAKQQLRPKALSHSHGCSYSCLSVPF